MRRPGHLSLLAALALFSAGCATKGYVNDQIAALEARLNGSMGESLAAQNALIAANKKTAGEALRRATEAGKLAEGQLLGQAIMTNEDVRFEVDSYVLSEDSRAVLASLIGNLKQSNKSVYIEVQGHADATGSEAYNMELGEERAEAVVDYLHREHQIPLHRLSAFSYGESMPVADNESTDGRAMNRRVVVVVMS